MFKRINLPAILVLGSLVSGCATISEFTGMFGSSEEAPKTEAPAEVVAETPAEPSRSPAGSIVENSSDADPSQTEFSAKSRLYSEKSSRGYRRNADPWAGASTANEGSLWNP